MCYVKIIPHCLFSYLAVLHIYIVSIVGSLRDREVACSASDRQGSNFESCVWRTVSSQSSHHPQEVLLAQFSLYVHKGGLKPDSFHFCIFISTVCLIVTIYIYHVIFIDSFHNSTYWSLAAILALSVFDYLREIPKNLPVYLWPSLVVRLYYKKHLNQFKALPESFIALCKPLVVHCEPPVVHCEPPAVHSL